MSNSLTYNAVDFGGANYLYTVTENAFIRPPQPRVIRDRYAQADGEAAQGATFEALTGVVRGLVCATSFANLKTQRNNLASALAVGQEGVKALTFDAVSGKSWQARVLAMDWYDETPVTIGLAITFYAPDPWPLATSATTGGTSNDGDGSTSI